MLEPFRPQKPYEVLPVDLGVEVAMVTRWWGGISVIRRFLAAYFQSALGDPGACERVALAAHELLENAVKYAQTPDERIVVRTWLESGHIVVRVSNRAQRDQIRVLRSEIATVMTGDPLETYLAQMTREVEDEGTSQLGLARIRYEAVASLSMSQDLDAVAVEARVALAAA
jgi:hypothetical protein